MKKLFAIIFLSSLSLSLLADPGLIRLSNATIDPASPKVANAETFQASPTASGKYQFIVQPENNFSSAELKEIKELGLIKIGTIPPNAYIFLATKEQVKELGELFPLLYCSEYKPEYKVALTSQKKTAEADASEKVLIGLATADSYDAVAEFLKEKNVTEYKLLHKEPPIVEASIPISLVSSLAAKSEVLSVEIKPVKKFMNDVARGDNLMNVDRANNSGYTGKGVMVIVTDTGLDSGDTANIHDDFQDKNVIGVVGELNTTRTDWKDLNGHGTHVAGSATGTGAHYGGTYAGTAREADLYFICLGDASSSIADLSDNDIANAYEAGGRVMNNSWGSSFYSFKGEYTSTAQYYDALSIQYPDLLLLFAAGNENERIDLEDNFSLGCEAVAKNSMTVGASESYRPEYPYTYGMLWELPIDNPYYNDKAAYPFNETQQGMAYFSSRGPAKDGRAKPDIVAPGTWIYSTESLYDDDNDGERKSYYTFMFGTSMATPLTSGAAACALQYLKENTDIASPSCALVKALLINGARTMGKGQFDSCTEIPEVVPNWVNGFGHVNLNESLNPSYGKLFVTEGTIEETGKTVSYFFTKESDGPVSATLCWSDYPGTVGAAFALVNDLDIIVSDGETDYYSGGKSGHNDYKNNCERCRVDDFPAGSRIEVKVSGFNVMEGPQNFALCVSGLNEVVPEPTAVMTFLLSLALLASRRRKC
ncbi:S8 family serine peptidase [bacterium]|nr:S8 family serine peptidase [bacterium]